MATNEAYEQVLAGLKGVSDVAAGSAKVISGLGWRQFRADLARELLAELEDSMEEARHSLEFWSAQGPRQRTIDEFTGEVTDAPKETNGTQSYVYAAGEKVPLDDAEGVQRVVGKTIDNVKRAAAR